MKHQQGNSQADLLVKDEDVRRLKLRILLLQNEKTALRDEITQNSSVTSKLSRQCEALGTDLEAKAGVVRTQEQQLRKQQREFDQLKVSGSPHTAESLKPGDPRWGLQGPATDPSVRLFTC